MEALLAIFHISGFYLNLCNICFKKRVTSPVFIADHNNFSISFEHVFNSELTDL